MTNSTTESSSSKCKQSVCTANESTTPHTKTSKTGGGESSTDGCEDVAHEPGTSESGQGLCMEGSKLHPLARLKQVLARQNYPFDTVRALGDAAPYVTPIGIANRPAEMEAIQEYTQEVTNAVRQGDMEKLWALVSDGKVANTQNRWGNSLLMLACRYVSGSGEAVKLLLKRSAQVCVCCDAGKTPMHDLCWMIRTRDQLEVVKLVMFEAGPPRNLLLVEDHHGQTPLDYLSEDLHEDMNHFIEAHKQVFWPSNQAKEAAAQHSKGTGLSGRPAA
jgi:hypothetical protein